MRRAVVLACSVAVAVMFPAVAVAARAAPPPDVAVVRAAGGFTGACSPLPAASLSSALPIGIGGCPGVRPGAAVRSDAGLCTLNFVFLGSDGERYVGTSAQCMEAFIGERTPPPGRRPVARDAADRRIGEFVYAVFNRGADFALIRLDPDIHASPEMCHFGGPSGLNDDGRRDPVVLHYYGNGLIAVGSSAVPEGLGVGAIAPGRSAMALGLDDPDWVFAVGTALYGDVGSGVISSDGRAVGALVFAGFVRSGTHSGTLGIIRLGPQLARAEKRLKIDLELLTAPPHNMIP